MCSSQHASTAAESFHTLHRHSGTAFISALVTSCTAAPSSILKHFSALQGLVGSTQNAEGCPQPASKDDSLLFRTTILIVSLNLSSRHLPRSQCMAAPGSAAAASCGGMLTLPVLQLVTNGEMSNLKRQLRARQDSAWARVQWGLVAMVQPHEMEVVQGRLIVADPKVILLPSSGWETASGLVHSTACMPGGSKRGTAHPGSEQLRTAVVGACHLERASQDACIWGLAQQGLMHLGQARQGWLPCCAHAV